MFELEPQGQLRAWHHPSPFKPPHPRSKPTPTGASPHLSTHRVTTQVLAAAHGEQLGLDGLRHRAVASLRPAAPLGDPGRNSGRAGGGKQKLPLPSWWNISGGRMVGWNQEDWV